MSDEIYQTISVERPYNEAKASDEYIAEQEARTAPDQIAGYGEVAASVNAYITPKDESAPEPTPAPEVPAQQPVVATGTNPTVEGTDTAMGVTPQA